MSEAAPEGPMVFDRKERSYLSSAGYRMTGGERRIEGGVPVTKIVGFCFVLGAAVVLIAYLALG